MKESKIIPENKNYGDVCASTSVTKSIIVKNISVQHIAVIAIDTQVGSSIEVIIRKDQIPEWLTCTEI
jgi:hypothetical protein